MNVKYLKIMERKVRTKSVCYRHLPFTYSLLLTYVTVYPVSLKHNMNSTTMYLNQTQPDFACKTDQSNYRGNHGEISLKALPPVLETSQWCWLCQWEKCWSDGGWINVVKSFNECVIILQ